jgi:hypothetical protein
VHLLRFALRVSTLEHEASGLRTPHPRELGGLPFEQDKAERPASCLEVGGAPCIT